jgi:hypothetical protein
MSDFDLLNAVQPSEGWFAIVGIAGGSNIKQVFVETRAEADEVVAKLLASRMNVFFGVAKFTDDSSRTKANVRAIKSLWMDIDCGPNKALVNESTGRPDGYATQQEALVALKVFTETVGFPKPIIVNSGRGLHVYWPFTNEVTRAEWEPAAKRLRDLCHTHDLYADPACFEAARVLRVPGTSNFKGEEPLPVTVLTVGKPHAFDELKELMGVKESPVFDIPDTPLSPLAQQLRDNMEYSFAKIMKRGADGCAQLNDCYTNRTQLSEPRWFSALSIAKFCKDRDKAIHKLSADHPDYDPDKTEQKLAHILGPHRCDTFNMQNPSLCANCPHLGNIGSPIVLGKELAEATAADNEIVDIKVDTGTGIMHETKYVVPAYPFPFVRGKHGGIYMRPAADDEETEPKLIFDEDLYIVRRMNDPLHGEMALVRLHTPQDGVKEFVLSNEVMTAERTEMLKALAREGVALFGKGKLEALAQYMIYSYQAKRKAGKVDQMRTQFGWADNYGKFIIGDREISTNGVFYSPPSSVTDEIAVNMTSAGTLDKWKEVFNLFGKPGLEGHAFAAGVAFGAPLLHMSGQRGAIVNLIHPQSGTGKTTILHMCNSVWGNPELLCSKQDDTHNSKIHKIGVFNSIPTTFDEMTNTPAKQLSEITYLITQGSGKDRMKGSSNELRKNLAKWRTIALCSSNASFYEKLQGIKDRPDGEMMRIIEFHIGDVAPEHALEVEYAKHMFDHQLMENYGHAGQIYAEYLVANYEEVKETYLATQSLIDKQLRLTQRERFWSAVCAAILTGIRLAIKLGLCDWDLPRITAWMIKMIGQIRTQTSAPLDNDLNILGDFINRHTPHMLIVNGTVDLRTNMQGVPLLEPRLDTKIRYEPDTKLLYVVASAFKRDCLDQMINYSETLSQLKRRGIFLNSGQKRMSKGTRVTSLPVQTLVFDGAHSEFIDLEGYAKTPETTNEGSGG